MTSTSSFFDFSPAGKSSAFVQESPKRRTIIGNDVWIGDGVRIASGVRVGNGAVIATGAVVVKDVDPYEIVGGIPAKRIKMRFGANIARNLEATKWWTYDPVALRKNLPSSPLLAAERLKNPDGRFDLFPQCHAKYEYSAPQQERDTPRLQCMAIRRMAARARRRLRF